MYRELRANGYTAVGEFHYLGLDEARAAAEAADEAGIAFVCLYALLSARRHPPLPPGVGRRVSERARGPSRGRDRGRRRPPLRARLPGRRATRARPLRGGARASAARPRRRAAAGDRRVPRRNGLRPIELLAREGCLGPRTTVVHATHADGHELDLLRDAGARDLRVPDDRGEPRRRLPAGRPSRASRASAVHRLRLERSHRPARGATGARRDRTPPDGQARRDRDRRAASDRLVERGYVTWPRCVAGSGRRSRRTRSCAA